MSLILDGTTGITPLVNSGFLGSNFRLTLTSGTPVTTSDVTAATTIYCTPYNGNRIALYDGTNWQLRASAEFSLALGTLTSGKPYDVFCYDNAGVPTLEFLVWTDDTTRATALVYQDGVLVKSGVTTRRYLGTFYTISTTQTCDMGIMAGATTGRYLWNYYNRVSRSMSRKESTATWNYTTATVRQANGSTSNQLNYVVGVAEDNVVASVTASMANAGGATCNVSIGVDSTTVQSGTFNWGTGNATINNMNTTAYYEGIPGVGRHYLVWQEYSQANGTTTWTGVGTYVQSGIQGSLLA